MTHSLAIRSLVRSVVAVSLAATAIVAPVSAHAAQSSPVSRYAVHAGGICLPAGRAAGGSPAIVFGRRGGNILPMQVAIYGDGTITYRGGRPLSTTFTMLPDAVAGLERLATAEGFWTMPPKVGSSHVLPDLATLYITVRQGCSTVTKTVSGRGGPLGGFGELYDVLLAATAQPA